MAKSVGIALRVTLRSVARIAGTFFSLAGMWFQTFSITISVARRCALFLMGTQEGEISFCAYNTGIGWKNVTELRGQVGTSRLVAQIVSMLGNFYAVKPAKIDRSPGFSFELKRNSLNQNGSAASLLLTA